MTEVRRSALGYLLIHGIVGVLGFSTYLAFSRVVSPDAYADYALIVALAGGVYAFLYSWIGLSVNRFFQDPHLDQAKYVSSIVVMVVALSAVVVLVQLTMMLLWPGPVPMLFLVAGPVITVLLAWFHLSVELSRARMQIANYGAKTLLRAILLLAIGTSLALAGWGASGLLIGFATGLLAAVLSALTKDLGGFALRSASLAPLRDLYAYGWPLAICLGLAWVVGMSDRYLLYWLIGEEAAGQYALGAEVAAQPVWLALTASSRAALPLAGQAYDQAGEQAAKAVLSQFLGIMLVICLPVVALEVVAAPQLAGLLLGQAYAPAAAAIMPIVAIATILQGLRSLHLDMAVHLTKRTRVLIGLWALAAGANVLLNLLLIPRLGIAGAAWATLIAHALATAYFLLRVPRPAVLGLGGRDLLKIVAALAVFVGLLVALRLSFEGFWFFIGAGGAGLIYGAICWLLDPVDFRGLLRLRQHFGRSR